MKQKLLAMIATLALCISLVGCNVSTPATVGTIGDIEITSGIYLVSQFQAYQTAFACANTDQKELSVADFLKETVYVLEDGTAAPTPAEGEEQTGEARNVAAFVETETMKNLQYYAAIETMFAELGGQLSDAELATAESYASQLWDNYGEVYGKNGIGESTLRTYQYTSMKSAALLDLIYGTDGTEPITDDTLTDYLNDEMVYGQFISVPLYNPTDYTFADETQQAEIVDVLNGIVDDYATAMADSTDKTGTAALLDSVSAGIEKAYDVMGGTYDTEKLESDLQTNLFDQDTLANYFDDDTLATINALDFNEATAFKADYTSAMVFLRLDPLATQTLDDVRDSVLRSMQSETLSTSIEERGASLTNGLDTSVTAKFPAKKVVNE